MTLCWEIPLLTSLFIGRRRPECTQRIKIIIQPVSRADPVECLGKHQMLSVGLRHHLQGYGIMDRIMVIKGAGSFVIGSEYYTPANLNPCKVSSCDSRFIALKEEVIIPIESGSMHTSMSLSMQN